ncbi:GNAT family N-acetyltransferase [Sodalis sp. C49]|uniref:GNAT family N-acetyltransferase n=1 Tax=unclassified Sodalis (in: enterobacteria) TaxID=2636512 RepID=UPI0039659E36
MSSSPFLIRQAAERDRAALSEICLKTANAGTDASALYSDPAYPGLRFVMPYAIFEPELAFVLEENGHILGYVVAARDTAAFEQRLQRDWWPGLREKLADRRALLPLDEGVLDFIRQPQSKEAGLLEQYPAHLHINILPQAQGGGQGRRMIETELEALRRAGVSGVHLGVSLKNEPVCAFYERLGFRLLHRSQAIYMGQIL